MGLKLVKGSTFDINLDPADLEINKRGDLGSKLLGLKMTELRRFTIFWVYFLSCGLLIFLSLSFGKIFIIPLAVMAFFTIRQHFRYLQAWSTWNKFARRHVARIDMVKEQSIYGQPMMPWVNIPTPDQAPKKVKKQAKK
jgi:hypothetical protein